MKTIHLKEINVSTKEGRLKWLEYKNSSEWTFLADTGTKSIFRKITEERSNCCSAKIIEETDVCSKCYEHCKIVDV